MTWYYVLDVVLKVDRRSGFVPERGFLAMNFNHFK
jgi:hypothetical protein